MAEKGLAGIDRLTEEDKVYLFYGPTAASMSFGSYPAIAQCKADIKHIGTKKIGHIVGGTTV